jgi:predicted GH43/DUF377 family glycosyl hydrolase
MFVVRRDPENPIISPDPNLTWQKLATFNGSPIKKDKTTFCFYRAIEPEDKLINPGLQMSVIGVAESEDGQHYANHEKFIVPENDWEKFGCEDPRVTFIDGKYYIFYTALSKYPFEAAGIKIAVAVSDNLKTINFKTLVTPFNAKAMSLFPEKINGKYTAILTANTDLPPSKMAIAQFDSIEQIWSEEYWNNWYQNIDNYKLELQRDGTDQVEVGAVPIKTEYGWLLIYSHIQNYYTSNKIFGIEAVLLDLDDPRKVIGRTEWPLLVPEAVYEKYGMVQKAIFPSGAVVEGDNLDIYYGSADTSICKASISLSKLLDSIRPETRWKLFKRVPNNPVLEPIQEHKWEDRAAFNPAAIDLGGKVHIFYRAMSEDNTSTIGYASSSDGLTIDERLPEPVYVPRKDFEMKLNPPTGFSGCEDPRVTLIDGKVYMLYTAYDGVNPVRIAMTSIDPEDLINHNWNWSEPRVISPGNVNDKNSCIFPQKINGKYLVMHRIAHVVCVDELNDLEEVIDTSKELFGFREGMWDSQKVGISAPPMWTEKGWLLLYHGVSIKSKYCMGAVLLDFDDPTVILARTSYPLFAPEMEYEKSGEVANVVFPCGAVIRDGKLIVYYGGGDKVVGIAYADLNEVLKTLE